MLLDHYGLREQPFGVTPNPRFLFLSPSHREALASLLYGIESGRGFLALIAPPGMGKTTLLFQLLERMGGSARTVFLFQTQCGSREFMRSLMQDLGISAEGEDLVSLQARLNQLLIDELQARRKFVLVVDEAQNLEDSALEYIRMLSNFETTRDKLMHIVLAGQPQLAEKLARPSMVQLRQRISMFVRLRPLAPAETAEYIEHRLRVAGYAGSPLFNSGALSSIASLSGGIPRNINNICFNALSLGYAGGRKTIDSAIIREVAADLDLSCFMAQAAEMAQPAGLPDVSSGRLSARPGADGWAVMLDRILSPARDPYLTAGAGDSAGTAARAAGSWTESSGWKEAVGTLANRLRDRIVH
ncbi:MAG TPA: AAA family ATPase [Terriglobia bacterium]|nr:AAA family ATPase [Terriglobia bacterium]